MTGSATISSEVYRISPGFDFVANVRGIRQYNEPEVPGFENRDSKGYETAKTLHLPATSRDVFLDNRVEESAILRQLHQLKGIASRHGHAVGIGHPFAETSRAIRHFLKGLKETEFELVHLSAVLSPAGS